LSAYSRTYEIESIFWIPSLMEDMVAHSNVYASVKASEYQLEGGRK